MKNPVFFKSKYGNQYFFDRIKKKVHYCNNELKHIIENNGISKIKNKKNNYNNYIYLNLKKNGYFSNKKNISNNIEITEKIINDTISNISQITFETTEKCNLKCLYCSYSDLYNDHLIRNDKDMSFNTAKLLIDYLVKTWQNSENNSHNKRLYISFYGGEPLLKIEFIEKIVTYIKSLNIKRHIIFSLTTNALLLDKYIEYLVENKFTILISIDGNEEHNSYRITHNNKNSFQTLYRNILLVKEKYPQYYNSNINFNSVLHNKNNATDVHDFILKEFNKTTNMTEIREIGINPEHKKHYKRMFLSLNKSISESNKKEKIINENFIKLPVVESLALFLHKYNGYNYNDYDSIYAPKESIKKIPSGTCMPFSKRIFITVNGLLLPCENVNHKYYLGKVSSSGVKINTKNIASYYNNIFIKLSKKCENCYLNEACSMCMYNMEEKEENEFVCNSFVGYEEFQKYLSNQISKIEETPYLYKKIIKSVSTE